ncbi:General transcription factor 3C polypeptide 5 [Merluccius polli]|uniref:General transcription factor 3C polypeptide 5 n=1 Tax=Merluccius polli TaxID=89951 RepID=A0AA47N4J6_MERPO|nr:General transcription factor 3C polypeptide 5 [Merluccius polli]
MSDSGEQKLRFTLKEMKISSESEEEVCPGTGSSSTVRLLCSKLVCVEYPAAVASVDKMLETIGGEQGLSKTFADPNRRLELRYRPRDPFCHSLCGNRFPSNNLLLRVRRRVRKKDPQDTQLHMEVLGVIGTTYKFQDAYFKATGIEVNCSISAAADRNLTLNLKRRASLHEGGRGLGDLGKEG